MCFSLRASVDRVDDYCGLIERENSSRDCEIIILDGNNGNGRRVARRNSIPPDCVHERNICGGEVILHASMTEREEGIVAGARSPVAEIAARIGIEIVEIGLAAI